MKTIIVLLLFIIGVSIGVIIFPRNLNPFNLSINCMPQVEITNDIDRNNLNNSQKQVRDLIYRILGAKCLY